MNLSCKIIQDLLLLYTDNACSQESRTAVEEHLAHCPACRRHMEALKLPEAMAEPIPEPVIQERVRKNSFRKLRRRWLLSVLAVLLLFPTLLLGAMGIHEYQGEGLAFTNLDEIFLARRLMSLMEKRRFEEAAELIDFESRYQEIQEILVWTPEDYMPKAIPCAVDGEMWAANPQLAEQYGIQELGENSDELWEQLVFHQVQGILIPERAWERIVSKFSAEELEYNQVYDVYFRIETPWGRFYTGDGELRGETEFAPENLVGRLDFVPEELFQAAQDGLRREALQSYQWNQEYYAFAADMSLEDYTQTMKDTFAQTLKRYCARGGAVQNPHFTGAYRMERQWEIEISSLIRLESGGESHWVRYEFMVQDRRLRLIGGSRPDELYKDPVAAALRLSRP